MEGMQKKNQLVVLHALELWYCSMKNKSIFTVWDFSVLTLPWILAFQNRPIEVKVIFIVTFHSRTMLPKKRRNAFKRFTIMVNRLEVPTFKTNAICFSFCKQNGVKPMPAVHHLWAINPTIMSVWVLSVWGQGGEEGGMWSTLASS